MKLKLKPATGLHWKYWLRITFMPILARVGRLLGASWRSLGKQLGRETLLAQGAFVRIRQSEQEISEEKLDVIFLTMLGGHTHNVSVDVVLGLALRARGHRVRFVVCDQHLPLCEVKRAEQSHSWDASCAKCWAFGSRYLSSFGFEVLPLSTLVADEHADDDWSEYVEASLLKHYRVGILDENAEVAQRRALFAESARMSAAAARSIIAMQSDRVIMSHGIYSTWGPALSLLSQANVPTVTYAKGKRRSTQKFNWNTSSDWWDVSAEWQRVRDVPLLPEQEQQLDDYLNSRRKHSQDTLVYNFGEEESIADTWSRLDLDSDKPTCVLFTNVLWDAASAQREIVFENPVDWVLQTIQWFSQRPDRQLVVKIHPAECVIGTKQPFAGLIGSRYPQLPTNVRLIQPTEQVNSWSIMQIADLGVVHTSTIGMELPLDGIPCAVVAATHFRDKGFTIDVEDKNLYFELLEQLGSTDWDVIHAEKLARRYAYLLFERYQLPWPFFLEVEHTDVRALNFSSSSDLLESRTMRTLVNAVEQQEDFLLPTAKSMDQSRAPAVVQ